MTIEQACRNILGRTVANAIIEDQGIHWAVVAAMDKAITADDPLSIAKIRAWNAEQKQVT